MLMNIFKKIVCVVCLISCGMSLFGQGTVTINRESYLNTNAACPKTEYQYWVDTKPNYGNYEWKITGGSFKHDGKSVKEINLSNISSVIVVWDNVKSSEGNAPKGTITLNIYKKNKPSEIEDNGKRDQNIKSLNDILPGDLISDPTSTSIPYGVKSVKLYLKTPLNFPGIKLPNGMPVPVNKYEWKIPQGWKPKGGGSPSSSGTYFTTSAAIELTTDERNGGEVIVRGVNDCPSSNDYSVYSWPIKFTRSGLLLGDYPKTVVLGESKTYEFSVDKAQSTTFEWRAPEGWKIDGKGNILTTGSSVTITTGTCYTEEKVKVGISVNGVVSSFTEFSTTVALPAINIPTGEIRQYQPATFSLDMPDDNISSVEWLVNGNSSGMATNTSSLSFRINESGKVKISAKLTLEGCSPVFIPEIEVDVTKAPDPVISGPATVCDEEAYTMKNLPPGATVQWSVNSNFLTIVSGQGTGSCVFRKNGYGESRIQAEISLDSQVIAVLSKLVSTEIKVSIVGDMSMLGCGKSRTWTCFTPCLSSPELEGPIRLYWTLEGDGQRFEGSSGRFTVNTTLKRTFSNVGLRQPIDAPHAFYTLSLDMVLPDGSVYSAPEEEIEIFGYITVLNLELDKNLKIYPNPTTDMVTVELQESTTTDASTGRMITVPVSGKYEIELWNMLSMVKRFATSDPVYRLSLSGLPAGIYFVRVIRDGEIYTKKLIKK